jgi:uncharacterized protein (DUF1015 family)
MQLKPFKAIKFNQKSWDSGLLTSLNNPYGPNRVSNTSRVMKFIKTQISNGIAIQDQQAGFYVLKTMVCGQLITALIGEIDYDNRDIFCQTEEINTRTLSVYQKLFDEYKMQINPVLAFYDDTKTIESVTQTLTSCPPDIVVTANGSTYQLWQISNPSAIAKIVDEMRFVQRLYIADGNHRFAMFYSRTVKSMAKIMIAIMDSSSIQLKSFHKVIIGALPVDWKESLQEYFTVILAETDIHDDRTAIILKLYNSVTYKIIPKACLLDTPIYETIKTQIIRYAFKIQKKDCRVFNVPGNLELEDAEKIFDLYKESTAIIFVPNLRMMNFLRIVNNHEKLPPTSTWIEPKIIDGLLIRKFSE